MKGVKKFICVSYLGEEYVEVVGHWLRKEKKVISQISIPRELYVNCVTHLLIESVHS
jgi:hypothetical protein